MCWSCIIGKELFLRDASMMDSDVQFLTQGNLFYHYSVIIFRNHNKIAKKCFYEHPFRDNNKNVVKKA